MLQAITTKYIGPTNYRGSRIKARCKAGSVTVPWDYAISPNANHIAAARALCVKLQWPYEFDSGMDHNQNGVHVMRRHWRVRIELAEEQAADLYAGLESLAQSTLCQLQDCTYDTEENRSIADQMHRAHNIAQYVMNELDAESTMRIIRQKECGQ
jgi:hypothetical protein